MAFAVWDLYDTALRERVCRVVSGMKRFLHNTSCTCVGLWFERFCLVWGMSCCLVSLRFEFVFFLNPLQSDSLALFRFVSFRFPPFRFIPLRLPVAFRCVSLRFVPFGGVSFRFALRPFVTFLCNRARTGCLRYRCRGGSRDRLRETCISA